MNHKDVLKKIVKLLKLSECRNGNVNEAQAAAAKAAKLMADYKISQAEVLSADEILETNPIREGEVCDAGFADTMEDWQANLLSSIANHQDCVAFTTYAGAIVFAGQESSVITSIYLWGYLNREIERLCKQWEEDRIMYAFTVDTKSFKTGASLGISKKLRDLKLKSVESASRNALVKLNSIVDKINEETQDLPEYEPEEQEPQDLDGMAYMMGYQMGKKVQVNDGSSEQIQEGKRELNHG